MLEICVKKLTTKPFCSYFLFSQNFEQKEDFKKMVQFNMKKTMLIL